MAKLTFVCSYDCKVWHDVGHSFLRVRVWVRASQRIPFSVLARNPKKGLAREISYETGRRRGKAKSQDSQQKKAVNRSWGKVTVRKRWLPSEELWPVDSEARSTNTRGWVSVPGIRISLGYTLVIARCTENHTKVSRTSPFLRSELTQVRARLFFFCFTLAVCMLCLVYL